ncbi:MAG: glutathione binding-like protein [Burkholderiales bacterium]|nr:glutathione binding-like protein [Burkholderiales bacterium]
MTNQPTLFIIPGACAFGSLATLDWLKVPYKVGITTPEIRSSNFFKQINPTGKVGALIDGKLTIAENSAILLYLLDKYSDKFPIQKTGTAQRAQTYQWLSFLSSELHNAFSLNLHAQRFVSETELQQFKTVTLNLLYTKLNIIDQHLKSNNGYFISDVVTIVDVQAFGLLRWSKRISAIELNKFPHIEKFLNQIQQLPEVHNAYAIEEQKVNNLKNSNFAGYYSF